MIGSRRRALEQATQPEHTRSLAQDESGAAAIEFAFVAIPFFALLFASLEAGLVYLSGRILENSVLEVTRRVYTGEVSFSSSADAISYFRREICNSRTSDGELQPKPLLRDCESKLLLDIRPASSFPNSVPPPIVTDEDGDRRIDPDFGGYEQPAPKQIVVVRAALEHPVLVSLLGANGSNLSANTRLLTAATAFRTEPF